MIYPKTKKTHSTNHNHLYHQLQPQPPLQPILSRGKKKPKSPIFFLSHSHNHNHHHQSITGKKKKKQTNFNQRKNP